MPATYTILGVLPETLLHVVIRILHPHTKRTLREVCKAFSRLVDSQYLHLRASAQLPVHISLERFPNLTSFALGSKWSNDQAFCFCCAVLYLDFLAHLKAVKLPLKLNGQLLDKSTAACFCMRCPGLEHFRIDNSAKPSVNQPSVICNFPKEFAWLIGQLRNLRKLDLSIFFRPDDIEVSLQALSTLTSLLELKFSAKNISKTGLTSLKPLQSLQRLSLINVASTCGAFLTGLASLRELVSVELDCECTGAQVIPSLCYISSLQQLELKGAGIDTLSLQSLGLLPHLTRLQVWTGAEEEIEDRLTPLSLLTNMKQLHISDYVSHFEWVECLLELQELSIELSNPGGLLALSPLLQLTHLEVRLIEVENDIEDLFQPLRALTALEVLLVSILDDSYYLSTTDMSTFAALPSLTKIGLDNLGEASQYDGIVGFHALKSVEASFPGECLSTFCHLIGHVSTLKLTCLCIPTAEHFCRALDHLQRLRSLTIEDAPQLPDYAFAAVARLTTLEYLRLTSCSLTLGAVGSILLLPKLTELHISNCNIIQAELEELCHCYRCAHVLHVDAWDVEELHEWS